ncbi:MAG: glycerol-3-phosphate dehydrogenase [Gemmatimonadota bacterium]
MTGSEPPPRTERLRRLGAEAWDLLVIGGGITGAAVARDAASRGFRTALVEARDFAEGTSSRSSRLVHGGLRYLEHFELDLVFEASQERRTLLRIAPHLVRPLEFLFPIYREGSIGKLKLDAGMWLYDALSFFRNIARHQMLESDAVLERERELRPRGLLGGARYFDAQVDDARLVLANVIAAAEAGAVVANRAEVVRVETESWPGHRVIVRDGEQGSEWAVDALAVVNATGPWTEETLARAGRADGRLVRPSRGTHIHLRRTRLGHQRALIFESPIDGRIMFVLPWRDLTLIGTTDEFDEVRPEAVAPTAADVRYLLDSTNWLFPRARLSPADVVSAWAGLRPLAVEPGAEEEAAGEVSRDFMVLEEPTGLFTVTGGKLTSNRAMAEATVDRVAEFLAAAAVPASRASQTARVPLPGGDFDSFDVLAEQIEDRAADLGLSSEISARLARAYGTRARRLLELVAASPRCGAPLIEDRPNIGAEVIYAVRAEFALHVEDVLYRRTHLGQETRDRFDDACRCVSTIMGEELGWPAERREAEVERARRVRERDDAYLSELAG